MKEEKKKELLGVAIREIRKEDRPRERALREGVRKLSDAELLAILIRTGTPKHNAIDLAESLLAEYMGHLDLIYKDFIDNIYPEINGLGEAKLIGIAAGMELGMRATRGLVDPNAGAKQVQASNSLKIYDYISEHMTGLSEEQMWLLCFNSQNMIIHKDKVELKLKSREELLGDLTSKRRRKVELGESLLEVAEKESKIRSSLPIKRIVSSGGYQETSADVRVILREALRYRAIGIAVVHNHPGGSLQPSAEDDRFTWRLYSACKVVGVNLLDHLIYTDRGYYSYFDHDRLEGE